MCADNIPLCLGILHALRLEATSRADAAADWLRLNGLERAVAPVRALVDLLTDGDHFAQPGEPALWPHEQAVLEGLARVDREPDRAEHLLAFLPPATRLPAMALLSELSGEISARRSARLRHRPTNPAGASLKPEPKSISQLSRSSTV